MPNRLSTDYSEMLPQSRCPLQKQPAGKFDGFISSCVLLLKTTFIRTEITF